MQKDIKSKVIIYPIVISYYNVIINGKNSYGQSIYLYIKRYEKLTKLITGQGQDYTTGFC